MKNNTVKASVEERMAASFRELVRKKDPDKITVREIADGAGVIRATFYNHFKDKADLLKYMILKEIIGPVHGLLNNGMHREAVVLIFETMKQDEDFFRQISRMERPVLFEDIAYECIYDLIYGHIREAGVTELDHPWLTIRIISELYAHIICFIAMEWIRKGMNVTPEEIGLVFEYIGTKPLWDILSAIEKDPDIVQKITDPGALRV